MPESKALAIIDVYEALTNWRPYKDPVSTLNAMSIIKEDVVKGSLDNEMFQDFSMALVGTRF